MSTVPSLVLSDMSPQRASHKGQVKAIAFSPDGQYLATGGADFVTLIWSVFARGFHIVSILKAKAPVHSLVWTEHDGVLVGLETGEIFDVGEVLSQPAPRLVKDLAYPVNALALAPQQELVAAGSRGTALVAMRRGGGLHSAWVRDNTISSAVVGDAALDCQFCERRLLVLWHRAGLRASVTIHGDLAAIHTLFDGIIYGENPFMADRSDYEHPSEINTRAPGLAYGQRSILPIIFLAPAIVAAPVSDRSRRILIYDVERVRDEVPREETVLNLPANAGDYFRFTFDDAADLVVQPGSSL
uniref:Uncharacterized protein n=1 Tax=Mycena chlorophos TaxID=658473 RepID=A0ABQ0KV15_MYCCL|nr:predicted protein [Mycena chlorophos]